MASTGTWSLDPRDWHFDIDHVLNPLVPRPPWRRIPYPIARFLGYRRSKPRDIGSFVPIFWAWIGIFIALSIIMVVSERIPGFKDHGAPLIVASFGAGAVLEFYAIESPLAQPRNFFCGQIIASVVGMSISKLFQMSPRFMELRWLAGATSCATVVSLTALTKTVHPPAGATALIAVVDQTARNIGWFFIAVVLFDCTIMIIVALLVNNISRAFPVYWWTPEGLAKRKPDVQKPDHIDVEKGSNDTESVPTPDEGDTTEEDLAAVESHAIAPKHHIVIRPGEVIMPPHIYLMQEELQFLEEISNRI